MLKKKIVVVSLLAVVFVGSAGYFTYQRYQQIKIKRLALEKKKALWQALERALSQEVSRFQGEAGVILKDLDMDWQIAVNKTKSFPSASLAKIPIMASCFYAVFQGKIKLQDELILKERHKVLGSGTLKTMAAGRRVSIENLIERMITESDNTATNMLIELLGYEYMNSCFKEFGLKDTSLARKMMEFKLRRKGVENYTTAGDVALLLEKMYRKEVINAEFSERCLSLLKQQKIKDRIPALLPPEVVIAHKTGLERHVCHDAGIVFSPGGNFLLCVLTSHTDKTSKRAKEFIARLAFEAYRYFTEFTMEEHTI
ncbi:MAG: hypothetical protein A2Y00_04085 [Omnitrophica WOR_2 bacterium GWF2_43_52]|nr:MAG: hypothetical protein A2Y01_07305 [Omnitrophica WOR_2 bacterium GWC2_44_8]OGX22608.1 MAG: hypothetical protein A2Y00_04085 [Omnitrophica WOR_2 bacterium GWF2_43_52]HAH21382.1 hypothetical protein [Candidatus Omnitrophota bacterium]HBG64702.1 hypothetical protein [Candidatus Omnitrophota bacterium]HCD37523.1 hypothetical protein [Candidatus Omnitrophota bacterium]